ncbi:MULTISPECIES: ROK family transcriptional regulator [unclassified Arthrobacter]|uniref:ROK family transcriptional regulator n=1 Tax=unclassified Arthrobacter TaxID=235627 RepID=UPI001C8485F1|nr:ROK family transcriptional regulator [Arthrobacter sp. MAHUQ-56]MBX7445941.1 ROK family transcriptional regulator [Arthrobacter sp. MAHUQ-56]
MASSSTLRHINQARVLDALWKHGPRSRVGLTELLGLQRSTITVITGALIEEGLVREVDSGGSSQKGAGRPRVTLQLCADGAYFAGLDLGNEMSTAIVVDLSGSEVGRASAPTDRSDPAAAERTLLELLESVLSEHPFVRPRLQGIGITVPGTVVEGKIDRAPILGWRHVTFGDHVARETGLPVFIDNDANAAAISESQFGVGRDSSDLLYILLDTGVGSGLVLDRRIYRGSLGQVGEAGHIRIPHPGSQVQDWPTVEDVIGISGLRESYAANGGSAADFDGFLDELHSRSEPAVRAADDWQKYLAWFTSTLVWMLSPQLVVFGGRSSAILGTEDALAAVARGADVDPGRTRFAVSAFGADAIAMGAAALPMSEFFALPVLRPEQATVPGRKKPSAG